MKKIDNKNYVILVVLLAGTIFLTLLLSTLYNARDSFVSKIYQTSNKITVSEFDQFMIENSDSIIYISDKYDLSHGTIEEKLQKELNEFNLTEKFVFLDKSEIDNKFIKKLKDKYSININLDKYPILISVVDKENIKIMYIDNNKNINKFIDYEVFE